MRAVSEFEKSILNILIQKSKIVNDKKDIMFTYLDIQEEFLKGKNLEIRYYLNSKKIIVNEFVYKDNPPLGINIIIKLLANSVRIVPVISE